MIVQNVIYVKTRSLVSLEGSKSSRFHRVFLENPDLLEMCFCFFELFEGWKSFGWVLVLVQTTSVSRSGIFPSTLFGFLSVILVVIHECKWYIATIERPVISKSLFFLNSWKAWNFQSTNCHGPWWPSPPTGSAEQPKLGGVLFSEKQQPCFDFSHPYRLSIDFFRCMWQVGLFFFGGEGGVETSVFGHSAWQKWNTLNHYPILQRSASTYHESQSLHDIIISSCLIKLHAYKFQVNIQKLPGFYLVCHLVFPIKTSHFWSPDSSRALVVRPLRKPGSCARTFAGDEFAWKNLGLEIFE